MRVRAGLVTTMVLLLALSAGNSFCLGGLERSAHSFRQYFCELKQAGLNPIERFVFSLVLAGTKTPRTEPPGA